jgi:restriction system protein
VFLLKGYSISETGGKGADGGIDLVLKKNAEVFLVQCKQWRAVKVSVTIVRELFGVIAAQGATGGFVVTSGVFTEDAKSFAKGRNIELIDGQQLSIMIDVVRSARKNATIYNETKNLETLTLDDNLKLLAPFCPNCGGPMVKRIAKQGANAGGHFWGCSVFPKCRGIRNI